MYAVGDPLVFTDCDESLTGLLGVCSHLRSVAGSSLFCLKLTAVDSLVESPWCTQTQAEYWDKVSFPLGNMYFGAGGGHRRGLWAP